MTFQSQKIFAPFNAFATGALMCVVVVLGVSQTAQAGEVYGGVGGHIGYGMNVGYAHAYSPAMTLRADFAGGMSVERNGSREGVDFKGKFTNNRLGVFADWFPFEGGFRLTGGLTYNDTKFALESTPSNGFVTINGKVVDMSDSYYNVAVKFPKVTPFLGIGYGHHSKNQSGLGFFTELGFAIGKFKAESSTNVTELGVVTQADIEAQNQKINNSLSNLSVLPNFSIGLRYNF